MLLRGFPIPKRMSNIPKTEIKPWPRIRRTFGFEPKQIADGALQDELPAGGAPRRLDKSRLCAIADHGNVALVLYEQRHVHVLRIGP